MTRASLSFMFDLLGLGVCATAAIQLVARGRRIHWPIYTTAAVTATAYSLRLLAPEQWTPIVYIAFEATVGLLALFVGGHRAWSMQCFMFAACAMGALLLAPEQCATAYVLLGIASLTSAVCVADCGPRDGVEQIARLGLMSLLGFQASRGLLAFAANDEPVLMAMLSGAGWAVHVTAFGLIAWAARR